MSQSTFTIERISHGPENVLVYREPGRELRLWMELTYFSRVAKIGKLDAWSVPDGVPIPPEQAAIIRTRLEQWGKSHRRRIEFVAMPSFEEMLAQMEQDGWIREDRADGSVLMTPEPLRARLKRLWRWMGRLLVSR